MNPVLIRNFSQEQHAVQRFTATVENDANDETVVDPKVWVNVASRCRVDTRISVNNVDRTYFAELAVVFVNGTDVRVVLLWSKTVEQTEVPTNLDGDYKVSKEGNAWVVRKVSTGEVILDKLSSKAVAYKELDQYLRILST